MEVERGREERRRRGGRGEQRGNSDGGTYLSESTCLRVLKEREFSLWAVVGGDGHLTNHLCPNGGGYGVILGAHKSH